MESYDIYELMIIPPNKKTEMIVRELEKEDKANLNLVRDLIVLGANVDWQGGNYNLPVLLMFVIYNHIELARILIDAGADLDIQGEDGETALHLCLSWNRLEMSKMLIDAGADVNIQDKAGWTALHWCAYYNRPVIARMLINAGADKTIPNNSGKLPYELAKTQELKELLKV